MRWIVWWFRSAFCAHEFKQLAVTRVFESPNAKMPVRREIAKECAKCGWVWKQGF